MMVRKGIGLGLAIAVDLCLGSHAAAHGRPPEVTQILTSSPQPSVVATTRGLLFGDPATHRWSLLCSQAFGLSTGLPYRIARLDSGRLYVASVRGVLVSDDQGCTWSAHPTIGALDVTYMLQDPAEPARIYVTIFGGEASGIQRSEDGGETFRSLYRAAPDEFLNTVRSAPGDPHQLYATLSTTDEIPRLFVLRSSDAGSSWARTELTLPEEVIDVSALAVNPVDANEVLLRVRYADAWQGDSLLGSRDGGRSFMELGRFTRISDAAFSSDGAVSFVVTSTGLLRARSPDRHFMGVESEASLSYGAVFDGQVLVSGYHVTDERLNVSVWSTSVSDADAARARWLSFDEVTSPKTCASPSTVNARCALDWIDWSQEFLPKPPVAP